MQFIGYDREWPLELSLKADPPVIAVVHVAQPSASPMTWEIAPGATVLLPIESSRGIFLVVDWRAMGAPGRPYFARLELSQRGMVVGSLDFSGTLSADGVSSRIDNVQIFFEREVATPTAKRSDDPFLSNGGLPTRSYAPAGGDNAEYIVWYGTNRKRVDPTDASKGYSAERDGSIDYGSCRVFLPKSHKIGSLGSRWWKRLLTMTDDRLRLLGISATSADEHWNQIRARLALFEPDEQDALVFVHGYNVAFEEAALRAAQIGFDLQIKGAMAFFSWPSQGTLDGYLADAATIEASEGMIANYLSDFAVKSGARTVHVIAHSMGNRGVLRAVNRIAAAAHEKSGVRFGQFILAAADVDADTFRSLCTAYKSVAQRTTLYVSERDRAVEASRWLHHFPRAGLIPPVLVHPDIDTINVTNVDLTMLGHGYVGDAREVLTDMHALIRHGEPPEDRFGLREVRTEADERYWLIGG